MKKYFSLLFLILSASWLFSQTQVDVDPFVPDALYNAVNAASAGDILVLADGGIYPNTTTLEVQVPLTIQTAEGAAVKARVVKVDPYPNNQINVDASLTIKNVIFNGGRGTEGPYGGRWLNRGQNPEGKIHLDGCEVYQTRFLSTGGDLDSFVVENCVFYGNISTAGNWGGTFDFQGDQLHHARIQNNTFMFCTFGPLLSGGWSNIMTPNQTKESVIIDHNTVYCVTGAHGPTTMMMRVKDLKITNNLYINPTLRPNEFYSDKFVDFQANEPTFVDVSIRTISELGPLGLWVFSVEMVEAANTVIDMQSNNVYYTQNVLDAWSSRGLEKCWVWPNEMENAIVDPENAYFEEIVTFTDAPAVPMYAVNDIADSAAAGNADPEANIGKTPFSGPWAWWDPATFEPIFDFRPGEIDMSYNTDATSYTAGIDGFPLGDLNWFPDKKAEWILTDVRKSDNAVPSEFSLSQNYPNPFNPSTKINFTLPESGLVTLKVFNVLGQEVAELINEDMKPGNYNVDFDASELSSGLYVYQITAGTFSSSKKMMLMK